MPTQTSQTFFAPQLFIPSGVHNIDFYTKGLGAVEHRRWSNEDKSIHVAELSVGGAVFHLHEENPSKGQQAPGINRGITVMVGIFVENVDGLIEKAILAGATLLSPAQDYDYGYRQGSLRDPFGHDWLIQKKI